MSDLTQEQLREQIAVLETLAETPGYQVVASALAAMRDKQSRRAHDEKIDDRERLIAVIKSNTLGEVLTLPGRTIKANEELLAAMDKGDHDGR